MAQQPRLAPIRTLPGTLTSKRPRRGYSLPGRRRQLADEFRHGAALGVGSALGRRVSASVTLTSTAFVIGPIPSLGGVPPLAMIPPFHFHGRCFAPQPETRQTDSLTLSPASLQPHAPTGATEDASVLAAGH